MLCECVDTTGLSVAELGSKTSLFVVQLEAETHLAVIKLEVNAFPGGRKID